MFSTLRTRFGIPGVISVIALVFAMIGGAWAANNASDGGNATASAKKKSKRGPRGPQGPAGPQGEQGPKGDKGDKGDAGSNGQNGNDGNDGNDGNNGTDGENVNIVQLAAENGSGNCEDGGAEFSNETGTAYACNGAGGSGGGDYPETLPEGHTMTGLWMVEGEAGLVMNFGAGDWSLTTISFPLPLASEPTETILIDASPTEEDEGKCPGSSSNPEAEPGFVCIYPEVSGVSLKFGGASKFGAALGFAKTDESFGTWAVQAPVETP